MPEKIKQFIEWDGKIPAWGLLLLGFSAIVVGYSWVRDIERRLERREDSAAIYRPVIDSLIKDKDRLVQVEVKLTHVMGQIDRLERKIDSLK